jgi:DNA polymerase elongation subunit (family B)
VWHQIADSIVQTGRETLENAIRLVNNTRKWGANVIYGDTDRYCYNHERLELRQTNLV